MRTFHADEPPLGQEAEGPGQSLGGHVEVGGDDGLADRQLDPHRPAQTRVLGFDLPQQIADDALRSRL